MAHTIAGKADTGATPLRAGGRVGGADHHTTATAKSAAPRGTVRELGNTETTPDSEKTAGSSAGKFLALKGMRALWKHARAKSLRECHRAPNPQWAEVGIDSQGDTVGLVNSRNRLSPMAAKELFRQESLEMQAAVAAWLKADGCHDVGMMTLTVRHFLGDSLTWLNDCFQRAWNEMNKSGKRGAFNRIKARYGVEAYRWAYELTAGDNGWHPHRHFLLFLSRRLSPVEMERLERELWREWNKCVQKVMGRSLFVPTLALNEQPGLDVRLASKDGAEGLAAYITKGMALEATGGIWKSGRAGGRTPHEILVSLDESPNPRDLALFREMESALRGLRWHGSSRGFKKLMRELGADEIQEELETAWREEEGDYVERHVLMSLERGEWRKISRDVERRAELKAVVLAAGDSVEARYDAAAALLDSWGIEYRRVMLPVADYEPVTPSALTSQWLAAGAWSVVPGGPPVVPGGAVAVA